MSPMTRRWAFFGLGLLTSFVLSVVIAGGATVVVVNDVPLIAGILGIDVPARLVGMIYVASFPLFIWMFDRFRVPAWMMFFLGGIMLNPVSLALTGGVHDYIPLWSGIYYNVSDIFAVAGGVGGGAHILTGRKM